MSSCRLAAIVLCFALLNLTVCQARRIRHGLNNREISKTKDGANVIMAAKSETPATETVQYDSIYGEWSSWGRCTRRCKEVRWRPCVSSEDCGDNILREERHCSGGRCSHTPGVEGPIIIPNTGTVIQKGRSNTDVQSLYKMREMVYSVWSEWSPCNRHCRTKRRRVCEVEYLCGDSVVEENYICIDKIGGVCDKLHREKKLTTNDMFTHYFNVYGAEVEEGTSVDSVGKENPLEKYESQCGISSVPDTEMALRIIGGRETVKGRWPWQVIILNRHKEPFCGGTVIAPNWIVTAAHCVRKRLFIRAGEHDLVEKEGTEQEVRVEESILHPDYDTETVDNDIALLRLRSPLVFDNYVKPACLPQPEENLPLQARAHILGWGKRRNTALYGTDVLHEAEVPVVDLEDCKVVYQDYHISQNMLCAGYKRGRVDSCAGDSGGPLLYRNDKQWAIYGVTSFGEGCGRKGKYGIYAKVSNFIGWIRRTIASK